MNNTIKQLRSERGLSQQELADSLAVSRQTVISLENGRYDPSLPLAFKIARFFALRIEEIFIDDT
ncbi:MAG TPA: helix-turn-helix transcriptional regulator [Cellvibrionaceae bacterium]|nr:helix-turn-helix transcriptional regulator [Cellvibrionaceae bacterium]